MTLGIAPRRMASGYVFRLLCQDGAGNVSDSSPAGRDAQIGASNASAWGTAGYYSTDVATGDVGGATIPLESLPIIDLRKDIMLMSVGLIVAADGAARNITGSVGSNVGDYGFGLGQSTGNVFRLQLNRGSFQNAEDAAGAVSGSAQTFFAMINGPDQTTTLGLDGEIYLEDFDHSAAGAEAASFVYPWGIGHRGVNNGTAVKVRALQLISIIGESLAVPARPPRNLARIVATLGAFPFEPVSDRELAP